MSSPDSANAYIFRSFLYCSWINKKNRRCRTKAWRCFNRRPNDYRLYSYLECTGFNPDFIGKDTEMYRDLALSTEMTSLGMDLARTPWNALTNNFAEGLPYLLLVLLVGLSAWYQQRMISNRSSSSMSEMPAQQQLLMKYMPFMLPIFSFGFSCCSRLLFFDV